MSDPGGRPNHRATRVKAEIRAWWLRELRLARYRIVGWIVVGATAAILVVLWWTWFGT